jgi:hypothetical protein
MEPITPVRNRVSTASRLLLLSLLLECTAHGETLVIRPSLAYTVSNLQGGVYQNKQARLFSNGYSNGADSNIAAIARMEFQIPPAVLAGLQSLEFKARQSGLTSSDSGYSYLWYRSGNSPETTKELSYGRSGFTAGNVASGEFMTRNLLPAFSSSPVAWPVEKFGLMITTHLAQKKEMVFDDPQLVATYLPIPENNGAAVLQLLTDPLKPFAGMTDPAVVGFDADPDGDGIANVFELWRKTSPDRADMVPALEFGHLVLGVPATRYPFIRVMVSTDADTLLRVRAQASHDLRTWRDVSSTRLMTPSGANRFVRFNDIEPLGAHSGCYFRFVAEAEERKFE